MNQLRSIPRKRGLMSGAVFFIVPILAAPALWAASLLTHPVALESPDSAAQPRLTVDATRGNLLLSWQARLPDGCAALRVREIGIEDGQLGPVREVAYGCDWFVNWADVPSVAVADDGGWYAHWLQRSGPGGYAYDIRMRHSADRGLNWSETFSPHRDGTPTQHGFVSMAPMGAGEADRMLVLWLDGRNAHADAAHHQHDHGHAQHGHDHEAAMSLRAAVVSPDGSLADEVEIDPMVCSCCPTGLLRLDSGQHLAIYRDRTADEQRDIALAVRDRQGWTPGIPVHPDGWIIAGCPVNGPAMAVRGEQVLAAWPTMAGAELSLRFRLLDLSGPPVAAGRRGDYRELERGSAVPGRVAVAAFDQGWLLSWLGAGQGSEAVLRLAWLDPQLNELQRIDVARLPAGRDVGMPSLAAVGNHALLAWTEIDESIEARPGQRRPTRLRLLRIEARPVEPNDSREGDGARRGERQRRAVWAQARAEARAEVIPTRVDRCADAVRSRR